MEFARICLPLHSCPSILLPSGGLEGPHFQLPRAHPPPPVGRLPLSPPSCLSQAPQPHPPSFSPRGPLRPSSHPEPGQWLSSLPATSLALPPGSVSPHPSIINPLSPVPSISLALSGCTGSEWGPRVPPGGPVLTQTRASQRVLGAPSPSPDPGPWLRPIVANIYICRVNSQEGSWAGQGRSVVTGPSRPGGRVLEEEAPQTESQRRSSGTPPSSHTIPAEGGI